jgi:hypothetical protein
MPEYHTLTARAGVSSRDGFSSGGVLLPKMKKLSINSAPGSAETDTGWDLPPKAIVLDVFVHVRVAEATGATKTIDVGVLSSESGGDADGFVDGLSVATIGLLRPTRTITTGSNTKFVAASPTRGVLLADHQAGTDVDQDEGLYIEKPFIVAAARSVTYTVGSSGFVEFRGDIYILYFEIP